MANETTREVDFASLFSEVRSNRIFQNINKFLNPEELIAKHGGVKQLRKMMHDDCIFAAFETRFDAAIGLTNSFNGDDEAVTEFIREAIGPSCLTEIITGALRAVPFGYNITELIYDQLETGEIILSEALNKSHETYKIDRRGDIFLAQDFEGVEPAPFGKYILSRHRADYDNHYGCSVLSRLYHAWMFRTHGWEFYVKFLEKFGQPIIHGKLDAKIDPETNRSNLEEFARLLDSSDRPTAIVTDMESQVEIFNPASNGQQFKEFTDCVKANIQTTILGQTLTSGNDGGGSNALGQVHNLVREDKRRSDIRLIETAVNRVIEYLGFLNEISDDLLPTFVIEDEKTLGNDRAIRDQALNTLGVRFTDQYFIEHYDLQKDDFTLESSDVSDLGFTHKHNCNKFMATPEQEALESLSAEVSNDTDMSVSLEEIEAIVRTATSRRDLTEKLTTVVGTTDVAFTDTLTQALFQARVEGFLDGSRDANDS